MNKRDIEPDRGLNAVKNTKVVIVGPLPTAIGGVSTHIDRLAQYSKITRSNLDIRVIDLSIHNKKWGRLAPIRWLITLVMQKCDILHIHKPDHLTRFWFILFFLTLINRKIIFTFHNENFADEILLGDIGLIRKYIFLTTCKRFAKIICVNKRMATTLESNGIDSNKTRVIPAFIAPCKLDTSTIPPEVRAFVDTHSPTLVGYVSNVYLYQGHDRYGGDMMLELTRRLRDTYPSIGLILLIPNADKTNNSGVASYREFVTTHNLESNIYICDTPVDMCSLFTITDIHIRPSNTDGDPIAVRESLALGVPTIASDCTFKPAPTIFHKDRDNDHFENVVRRVIDNLEDEKIKLSEHENNDFGEEILCIYDEIATDD